jgi:rhodanese-related sulfurtransferase
MNAFKGMLLAAMVLHAPLPALSINDGTKKVMAEAAKVVREITPQQLQTLIDKDEELYLIDIREKDQQLHGEIFHLNLVRITRGYLEFKVEREIPDKKAMVVVYCCTGKRGLLTAKTLEDMGYTNVYSLQGGIRAWVEQGHVLDTAYGEMVLKQ